MNSNHFNDDEIQSLLKRHQPVPPPAPKNLLNTLVYRMGFEKRHGNQKSIWLSVASGLASFVFVFTLIDRQFNSQLSADSNATPSMATSAMMEDEDDGISNLDAPTLNVGEDYLELVSR